MASTADYDHKHGEGTPLPPSRESRLCRVCTEIDFDRYLGEKIGEPIDLGSWHSICQSLRCPFCRLVTRCLESSLSLTPRLPDTHVLLSNELSWKLGIELSPYDRSKSESYSNKYDLRSMAGKCFLDAYRFTIKADGTEPKAKADGQRDFGMIQYLGYNEKTWRDRQFFGRRVCSEEVDVELLRHWLKLCSKCHGAECATEHGSEDEFNSDLSSDVSSNLSSNEHLPANLRLVDVLQGCIVRAQELGQVEYVALSYVWGKEEMQKDTGMTPVVLKRNMIKRKVEGECTPLPETLPRTIKDAMKLTGLLAYRYLWCDALCIVQDDTLEEKIPHLTNMKAIYSLSTLTIAAAAGSHVDYGLPGVSVPRTARQYSELVGTLRLATMFPSFSELENSSELLWNRRAWTFQEKLLSKRILLFTDYQAYYKCSEAIWTEEVVMETGHVSTSVEARPGKYRWQPNRKRGPSKTNAVALRRYYNPHLQVEDEWDYLGGFLDYAASIQEYTRRKLSDERDKLFAISGVLETMEEVTGRFFLGLPRKHFLESLLWYPEVGCLHGFNKTDELPSWTWASSTFERKGISFDLMDVRQLRALINLTRRAFPSKKENESSSDANDDASYVGLVGTYANLMACLTRPLLQKDLTIRRLYFCHDHKIHRVKFSLPVSAVGIPGLTKVAESYAHSGNEDWRPSPGLLPPNQYVLAFGTVVVRFRIGRALSESFSDQDCEVGAFELLNSNDECVGEVITTYGRARLRHGSNDFLTVSWGLSLQHAEIHDNYTPRWRFSSKARKKSVRASWLGDDKETGLARLKGVDSPAAPLFYNPLMAKYSRYIPKEVILKYGSHEKTGPSGSELGEQIYLAKKGQPRPRSLWTVVNLMLVDWDGHLARRAGVGKVIIGAWMEKRNPQREVILT